MKRTEPGEPSPLCDCDYCQYERDHAANAVRPAVTSWAVLLAGMFVMTVLAGVLWGVFTLVAKRVGGW